MMNSHSNDDDDYSSSPMHSLVPVDYGHDQTDHHHQLAESSSSMDDHVLAQLSASADWRSTSGMLQTSNTTIVLFEVNGLLDPSALWLMPHYFDGSEQVDSAASDGTTIANPWHLISGNGLHSHSEVAIDSSDGSTDFGTDTDNGTYIGPNIDTDNGTDTGTDIGTTTETDNDTDATDAEGDDHGHVTSSSTKPKKKMTKVTTFEWFTCAHCTGFKAKHRSMLLDHMNTVHPRECPLMLKGCVHRNGNDKNTACTRKVVATSWLCAHPDCSVRGSWKTKKSFQTHYHRYHEKGEYRCAKCVASPTFEYQAAVYAHAQDKHPTAKILQSRGMAPKRNYPKKKENYQRGVTLANGNGSLGTGGKVECPWKDPRSANLGKSAKAKREVSVCGKSFATTGNMKRHFQMAHPEQYLMVKWERKKYTRRS